MEVWNYDHSRGWVWTGGPEEESPATEEPSHVEESNSMEEPSGVKEPSGGAQELEDRIVELIPAGNPEFNNKHCIEINCFVAFTGDQEPQEPMSVLHETGDRWRNAGAIERDRDQLSRIPETGGNRKILDKIRPVTTLRPMTALSSMTDFSSMQDVSLMPDL